MASREGLAWPSASWFHAHAGKRRHGGHALGEVGKIHLDRVVLADLHEPLEAALVIDGAGHPDRLVGRAEMRVAADLHGDVAAQAAEAWRDPRPRRARSASTRHAA